MKGCVFMANQYSGAKQGTFNISQFIIRLLVGAIVLAITAALTPGFRIAGLWSLILGAVVLAVLDYLALRLLGANASPFGRGITGFILAAVIIYLTQFFVTGFTVTIFGAIIGALIYGVVDAIIPGRAM
jgi:putative membrane protein